MISILFIIVYFFENAFAKFMPKGLRMFLLQKENPGITGAFRGGDFFRISLNEVPVFHFECRLFQIEINFSERKTGQKKEGGLPLPPSN